MDLNLAKTALEQGITFVRNAGLQVVELKPGYVKCLMPFRNNGNHIGSMYAGALFTVAEIPGGALFLSSFDTSKYFPRSVCSSHSSVSSGEGSCRRAEQRSSSSATSAARRLPFRESAFS